VRIELKPAKKLKLTTEEIAAREQEKAALLITLDRKARPAVEISRREESVNDVETNPVIEPAPVLEVEPLVEEPTGPTAAELEKDIAALQQQLAVAKQREQQAKQAALRAQQQQAQAVGREQLAPLQPRLARHLEEVSRIQRAYGPTLKDFARSMPSDSDPQVRRKIGEVYRAAAPLGQRLGDARATVESAIRGLTLAMASTQPHVHSQAAVLSEAALAINLLSIETECKTLVQLRNELRPGYHVHAVTDDHVIPQSLSPRSHTVSADFGPSLT
jgi:small-conductance mechanosensitive channel